MLNMFKGALVSILLLLPQVSYSESLMNIVDIKGIRSNEIVGYGLVVGLDGTGDKSQVKFTSQSVTNMIKQFGVQLDDRSNPKIKNVAAVSVTATISPMLGEGQKINVIVSSLGDATSLRGGTLILTPLHSIDGEVYAVAQGNVTVGGLSAKGEDGSSITINIPTVGRIPNGAVLEREVPNTFNESRVVTLNLRKPNFTTAKNISSSINKIFGAGVAEPVNFASVEVTAPMGRTQRVAFMSMLDEIEVEQGKDKARLIFNSRTGTVVISKAVRISEVAISHGGITISIQEDSQVSQANAFSERGTTEIIKDSTININKDDSTMMVWPEGVDLRTIVNAVNQLGASVDDLMQILQALDAAGALNAELIVI
ncbi:flagellar biosynthesis protein FlgI [Psychromonas sp. Urea-02u-13]|uniref:flagellar basal body P-ring protein FlgI n=2 Tax=Psychromonas sp. Urea-02u-13 TaxID=2058326 RepID=UPI000C3283B8|nr:flagellar basal body P-ring protein FlgI [Psychromonas sp. Urea-02u-13]PKG39534.1 flagellar biosynthesis protein FlgI [Psychromonas sp. Urea-02u-13]